MVDALTDDSLDLAFLRAWIEAFILEFGVRSAELTELDRRAGDGDFGRNLIVPLEQAHERLAAGGQTTVGAVFDVVADVLLRAGGTSGPLLGAWFREFGRAGEGGSSLDLSQLTRAATGGLHAVQRFGSARPGDRTMVDAMAPAAEALDRANADGATLVAGLAAATAAARAGASATSEMIGTRGRASYVGESARGSEDPGAVTIAMFFAAALALDDADSDTLRRD